MRRNIALLALYTGSAEAYRKERMMEAIAKAVKVEILGEIVKVRVTQAEDYDLLGELIE